MTISDIFSVFLSSFITTLFTRTCIFGKSYNYDPLNSHFIFGFSSYCFSVALSVFTDFSFLVILSVNIAQIYTILTINTVTVLLMRAGGF